MTPEPDTVSTDVGMRDETIENRAVRYVADGLFAKSAERANLEQSLERLTLGKSCPAHV